MRPENTTPCLCSCIHKSAPTTHRAWDIVYESCLAYVGISYGCECWGAKPQADKCSCWLEAGTLHVPDQPGGQFFPPLLFIFLLHTISSARVPRVLQHPTINGAKISAVTPGIFLVGNEATACNARISSMSARYEVYMRVKYLTPHTLPDSC